MIFGSNLFFNLYIEEIQPTFIKGPGGATT